MSLPESTLSEAKPSGGFTAIRPRGIPVYLGVAARGSTTVPGTFGPRKMASIASAYGAGPLSRKAAYCASQTSSACLVLNLPATARAASKTAATVARNASSDFTYTLTGTPTNGADVAIKFGVVGGLTGTGPIGYQVSVDGGGTYGTLQALGTATTIVVLGVTVTLGSGKVVTAADQILWFQRAASASVLPQTLTKVASSSATYVVSGTPADAYRFRLEWLVGGTVGTAGASYRYCLDWDGTTGTWSPNTALNTATTILPLDGVEASGLTITLATSGSGTIDAGDNLVLNTTAPEAQWSDIAAAMAAVRASGLTWSFFAILTPLSGADCASADTLLTGWAAGTRRTFAFPETRDREATETTSAWAARVRGDFSGFTSTRVFPSAGHAPMADPITGRRDRRSCVVDYVTRIVGVPQISTDPGQVSLGALPASRALYASDAQGGAQLEYDADADPQLFDAQGSGQGFLVLRTFEDDQFPGTYPAGGICMPSAGDLGLIALRRVLDAFEDGLQSQARRELVSKFRRWTAVQVANSPIYKAGDVFEADARAVERRLRKAGLAAVVTTGDASGITVILTRTPVNLGGGKFGLQVTGKCAGLGYVYGVATVASLADPAFDA